MTIGIYNMEVIGELENSFGRVVGQKPGWSRLKKELKERNQIQ